LHAGGQEFHYIPCLNDSGHWITALSRVAQQHLAGWPTEVPGAAALADARSHALAAVRQRVPAPVEKLLF
jgi:ferrochelatase